MRKRKAVILFGTIFAMLIGYVAWCWRGYYLAPEISWEAELTKAERVELKEWIADHAEEYELRPEWSWSGAWYRLRKPYEHTGSSVWVFRSDRAHCYARTQWSGWPNYVELRKVNGAWQGRQLTWEQSDYLESRLQRGEIPEKP